MAKLRIVAIEVHWSRTWSVYDTANVSNCTVAPSSGNMKHETDYIRFACRIVFFLFLQPLPEMNIRQHSIA
jgi:hypothetical protein